MSDTEVEQEVAGHYPYVCTDCGREVRMVAEIVPDDWDSYKNAGRKFACECTTLEEGEADRPVSWEVDLDNAFGPEE